MNDFRNFIFTLAIGINEQLNAIKMFTDVDKAKLINELNYALEAVCEGMEEINNGSINDNN